MKRRTLLSLPVTGLASLSAGPAAAQDSGWAALRDVQLQVDAGSLLDFSGLADQGPAGRWGWAVALEDGGIGFEKQRSARRFFSASFAFSPPSGGFPAGDEAAAIVQQLRRTGYNAVRLQNVDANLMTGRTKDFDFDPEQLDRFDRLFSLFKEAGIHVVMDVMYVDNGGYGNVFPHRWVKKYNLRQDLYLTEDARAHWLQLLKSMLGRRNKYTGTVPLQDPALLGLIFVNEGGLVELAFHRQGSFDAPFPKEFGPAFGAWRRRRAGQTAGVAPDSEAVVPDRIKGRDELNREFMSFVVDREVELFRWMQEQARALGFGGLATAFNNWSSWQSDITRSELPLVDMHGYHVLPSRFADPGSRLAQTSAIADSARFVRQLAIARHWGKPFTVTEYGQPFWNAWRHESVALVPAYAAFQGWSLIAQFAENPVQLRYEASKVQRRSAIYPFGIGADPVLRAGEHLAALLYQRADVDRAAGRVTLQLDRDQALGGGDALGVAAEWKSRLSLITGVGLKVGAPSTAGNAPRATVLPANEVNEQRWLRTLSDVAARVGLAGSDQGRLDALKAAEVVPKDNPSDLGQQVYVSDTRQLRLQARDRRFLVDTPRTAVIVSPDAPARAGAFSLDACDVPVTVALSAMDGKALAASGRLLLMVLTDARNSGMKFQDGASSPLVALGGLPVLVQTVRLRISWHGNRNKALRAYVLALDGSRREALPVQMAPDGWSLALDTGALPNGPALYFELTEA